MRRTGWAFDAAIALALAVLGVALLAACSRQLPPVLFERAGGNIWFEADTPRVLSNMVSTTSNHYRTKVHPIASIVIYPLVAAGRALWPGSDLQVALRFGWLVGACWIAGFYALCRLLGAGRVGAGAFCLLAMASGAFVFWFSIPETFGPGSLTLLAVLLVAAVAGHRPVGDRWLFLASVASLSITVTNWMAGLALAFVQRPWRRALRITAAAFALVAALAVLQRFLFSFAKLFFLGSREELDYVNLERAGSLFDKLAGMLASPMVVPEVRTVAGAPGGMDWLTVQLSMPGSGGWPGALALAGWCVLLAAGAWGLARAPRWRAFGKVLAAVLAGQVLLHAIYGEETFLYAAHFLPLLMALAVFARHSPLGRLAPALALAVAAGAAWHNLQQFGIAVQWVRQGVGA